MTETGRDTTGAHARASGTAAFYDSLAADYHRLYRDWDAAVEVQAGALDVLLRDRLGPTPLVILDCAVGIGTQTIGLLRRGHQVTGTDISIRALARARSESGRHGVRCTLAGADMRALPFADGTFDAVICADNAVAHLLAAADVVAAMREMARVSRPGGLVVISVRDYAVPRRDNPPGTPPQVSGSGARRSVAFQVWRWHPDGRVYDLEHFTVSQQRGDWRVRTRHATLAAYLGGELMRYAGRAGLDEREWALPVNTGFFQPLLIARSAQPASEADGG